VARVVICDDSRVMRRLLRRALEEAGHVIVGEAQNGQEGVNLYKKLKPDVMTMDINMPLLSGLEATKEIRREFPVAKVIIVSSMGQKWYMDAAREAGAKGFLVKPFSSKELRAAIC